MGDGFEVFMGMLALAMMGAMGMWIGHASKKEGT
jgi:hypothetical protein